MRSIRLDEWALTILNETIRADAEFQINQRSAWQEFERNPEFYNGVDITQGMQHQRSLMMNELTFEFGLIPDVPQLWDRVLHFCRIRRFLPGSFYRLKRAGEQDANEISVTMIIKRDSENRIRSEVQVGPDKNKKPEEIHVVDVVR